eukprot:m.258645 g.258645  ORF g.258645 m.258645 type:complete len:764 (-) comp15547_c1_seq1:225-2516(-)
MSTMGRVSALFQRMSLHRGLRQTRHHYIFQQQQQQQRQQASTISLLRRASLDKASSAYCQVSRVYSLHSLSRVTKVPLLCTRQFASCYGVASQMDAVSPSQGTATQVGNTKKVMAVADAIELWRSATKAAPHKVQVSIASTLAQMLQQDGSEVQSNDMNQTEPLTIAQDHQAEVVVSNVLNGTQGDTNVQDNALVRVLSSISCDPLVYNKLDACADTHSRTQRLARVLLNAAEKGASIPSHTLHSVAVRLAEYGHVHSSHDLLLVGLRTNSAALQKYLAPWLKAVLTHSSWLDDYHVGSELFEQLEKLEYVAFSPTLYNTLLPFTASWSEVRFLYLHARSRHCLTSKLATECFQRTVDLCTGHTSNDDYALALGNFLAPVVVDQRAKLGPEVDIVQDALLPAARLHLYSPLSSLLVHFHQAGKRLSPPQAVTVLQSFARGLSPKQLLALNSRGSCTPSFQRTVLDVSDYVLATMSTAVDEHKVTTAQLATVLSVYAGVGYRLGAQAYVASQILSMLMHQRFKTGEVNRVFRTLGHLDRAFDPEQGPALLQQLSDVMQRYNNADATPLLAWATPQSNAFRVAHYPLLNSLLAALKPQADPSILSQATVFSLAQLALSTVNAPSTCSAKEFIVLPLPSSAEQTSSAQSREFLLTVTHKRFTDTVPVHDETLTLRDRILMRQQMQTNPDTLTQVVVSVSPTDDTCTIKQLVRHQLLTPSSPQSNSRPATTQTPLPDVNVLQEHLAVLSATSLHDLAQQINGCIASQ